MKKILSFLVLFFVILVVTGSFASVASAHHATPACESITLTNAPDGLTAVLTPGPINLSSGNGTFSAPAGTYTVTWSNGYVVSNVVVPSCSYTVTATGGSNGTITPGTQSVNSGSTATLTVTPATGYTASASGCSGSLSGTTFTTGAITSSCSVTATFTSIPVKVDGGWTDWSAKENNTCGASGTQTRTCTIPTPANGGADCSLLDSGNASRDYTNDSCSIPVATISATKIICPTENLLPNWGANGPDVTSGTASAFIAANPTCHIVPWTFEWAPGATSNPGDEVGIAGGAWTSFTGGTTLIPTGNDIWVREQFNSAYIPFTGVNTTENVSAELYCNTDVLNYDNYDEIYNPNASTTYYCIGFNVLKTIPVQTYTVTATGGANGTIDPATRTVNAGATTTFTVTPTIGYTATATGCSGTLSGTTYTTGAINANCEVSATFTATHVENLTVTASAVGNGTITPGSQSAATDTSVIFTVTPATGYTATMGGTCPAGTPTTFSVATSYTTGNITANCSVIATFTQNQPDSFTLTINTPGTGTGVITGAGVYTSGTIVTATATPNSDSTFTGWSENCPGGVVTVTANTTCTATFTLKEVAVVRHHSSGGSMPQNLSQPQPVGRVLGAETTCGIYVDKYMRMGLKGNDKDAVVKVQNFLNSYMGTNLKIDGIIGIKTDAAIRAFQVKQFDKVLYPWGLTGSTGIFYLTTQTEVNNIMCPALNLPIPPLVPMDQNPLFPKF